MSGELLDPEAALRIVLDVCAPLPAEACAIAAALGRILAAPVASPCALPPFDNSAMDGYALGGGDEPLPAGSEWPIEGEQAAGAGHARGGRGAWEIMTGASLPDGLDRVIPLEQTQRLDAPPRVRLLDDVAPGQNVREAGSDVARGDVVLAAGTPIAPHQLMLLAALGVAQVPVMQRPRVAVLSTGRELVDDPAQPLASGQIRNSNGPFLAARLPLAGAECVHAETLGDDEAAFNDAVRRALDAGARVLISTGAVSMGRYDFVPQALQRLGAQVLFHKLAIRPGKPLLFARLPDGSLFFGLPGNPIAVAVGLRFFVEPALRALLGLPRERPLRMPLHETYAKKPRLRFHLKARVEIDTQGRLGAMVLPGQESYRIRPLAEANAWVVVPADVDALPAGTLVDVYGLGHLQSPMPCGIAP
jgi:molybdopterin molybdotransferase